MYPEVDYYSNPGQLRAFFALSEAISCISLNAVTDGVLSYFAMPASQNITKNGVHQQIPNIQIPNYALSNLPNPFPCQGVIKGNGIKYINQAVRKLLIIS